MDLLELPIANNRRVAPVIWASVIGTTIEWYDFLVFGTAAALVLNKLFFPNFDPVAGTLAAFGSYAVGFVSRPLGGAIFGHFGDRLGRRSMLVATMLIMGVGTFLIGCLPTYAQIGVWAPVLLITLRFLQGIGIGGEWGGAVLMVIEHAPPRRRGLYGSLVQLGFPLGIAGSVSLFRLASMMGDAEFLAWGWRLPFLASAILVVIGLFVRLRLTETPLFRLLQGQAGLVASPVKQAVIIEWPSFLIAVGLKLSEVGWVYILTVFAVSYATGRLGLDRGQVLNAVIGGALLELITLPAFGWLSDRVGRRPVFLIGTIISILAAFPVFWLLDTRDMVVITLTLTVAMSLTHAMMFGPEAAFLPELFGTQMRYSGASLGCQVSAALSGGFSPIIATALLAWTGGQIWSVSLMMVTLGLVTLISVAAARETAHEILRS
jgi:metabolite-proton symporter